MRPRLAAVAAAALLTTGVLAAPASAGPSLEPVDKSGADVAAQVAALLAEHPDATQVGPRSVAWEGGDVVLTLPDPQERGATASAGSCGGGWSCLFEHSWYGGRMLQFRSCGYRQSLGSYGFANQASSWVNNRGQWTRVGDGSSTVLWTEYGYASASSVGWANDRADWIHLLC
ncbi:hypothetical protein GCM10027194_33460 [Thalassiella azotivora]